MEIDKEKFKKLLISTEKNTTRNIITARSFVREVLNYCENEPKFVVDRAPWLKRAVESLGLEFEQETFREA
ncbi:transposase IS240-A [Ferroglobus placidus DSM 10642]|uniref:Transposase IS240-A n=1 Tax=Ferroglobus placidus (strain DSM 10642 / AEDII12DO) TaxID=589924 RepID=D3S2I4_FERPA|nr:IS6 family transposase [Ferroglobus placidus]ADC64514.1 transposase IS240-A [Ferroglobus placidus DSM 10642]